jgi:tyrosyl-tRNA synthetase
MDPIESKMSKSNPASGILIHDTPEEVTKKINGAVCPQGQREGNPLLDLVDLVVFRGLLQREIEPHRAFVIDRPEKFGGRVEFATYADLEAAFLAGKLHPADLKKATAGYVNEILADVRGYFERKPQNLERMRQIVATR